MKIAVVTATRQYGGLDVTLAALLRQTGVDLDDLLWIIADDLFVERHDVVEEKLDSIIDFVHLDTYKYRIVDPSLKRTLARAYADAFTLARHRGADMLVSLQDYIVPPDDGIARFVALAEKHPNSLLSGLMSFSTQPSPDEVVNPKGRWTIFADDYTDTPPRNGWQDIRADHGPGVYSTEPLRWETNWAAVSKAALHDMRLTWSREYDYGVAYENQDFAAQAAAHGYEILVDTDNHAVGLPHRAYWPEQELDEAPFTDANRALFERKWGN